MTVVLARCSGPDWVRSAAPTASAAESCSVCFAASAGGLRVCSCCCARYFWAKGSRLYCALEISNAETPPELVTQKWRPP
jgi:hypothetical protein